ncbi:beta-ketoacyl synthase N-terminal-like domain-containing protein [Streptomyces palmae]|uniref:3-oxoacyl-ACP synthase n=1 Tax=Streptomyces palmae TaxID=1701085 RepID=A0A4Z0HIN8_9ACTN|nr:beta-ketoacyl synthase N-terminal-like domain-containing protein [Streptomyces palmae]TGB19334.1 3-oxoacyl-ACP synthase [Streptomyces palmae]
MATTTGHTDATELVVSGIGEVLPPADAEREWFDYRTELGPSGYKYVPRSSRYLLGAGKRALADAALAEVPEQRGLDCGVALGSNNCASDLHGVIDRAVLEKGLGGLRPTTAPYFSVNLFLSKLAIEHGLKGFSLALHTPRVAGLESIETGLRAVALGRASWLVLGVTEEPLDPVEPEAASSEDGAVVLVLEPAERVRERGATEYGRVAARGFFLSPTAAADPARAAGHTERLLAGALAALGLPDQGAAGLPVRLVADASPVADALAAALGAQGGRLDRTHAGPGCLGPMTEVARALRDGEECLVVAAGGSGQVTLARIRPTAR